MTEVYQATHQMKPAFFLVLVAKMNGQAESGYGPRRAAYDLTKLRGKAIVRKIGT